MKDLKFWILFYSLFFSCESLIAQSFQISKISEDSVFFNKSVISNLGEIAIIGNGDVFSSKEFFLAYLTENGNFQEGYKVSADPDLIVFLARRATFFNNRISVIHKPSTSVSEIDGLNLFSFDSSTEEAWMKGKENYFDLVYFDFDIDSFGNHHVILNPYVNSMNDNDYEIPNIFEVFFINIMGNTVWKKGYEIVDPILNTSTLRALETKSHPNGDFYNLGAFRNNAFPNGKILANFILRTDQTGNPVDWIKILDHQFDQIFINPHGEIYLLGKTDSEFDFTDNEENAILMKLDENLNEIWTKVYHAENFKFFRTTMNVTDDGSLYLAYSTFGSFPVILAKLSSEGEIIWEKGYPLYEPEIDVFPNGSLFMKTSGYFDSNNDFINKTILTKTDTLGNIENCETFPTCLQSTTIVPTFGELQVDTFSIPDLDDIEVFVEPWEVDFEDFCDTPAPPHPEFSIADTICPNTCERTFDTYNFFAHGIEWQLTGPNVDVLLKDSLNATFCFEQSGNYILQQTIWFLGCAYTFEKNIVVKDSIRPNIIPDSTFCEDFPITLSLENNNVITSYNWSTGGTSPTTEIFEEGIYLVEVSDGLCFDKDSILFKNILEKCPLDLMIPNAFTPDGDGVNDDFAPIGDFFELQRITIYNRWGQTIFDESGTDIFWDGSCGEVACVSDVYVYRIQYFNEEREQVEFVTGDLTLIR